MLMLRQRSMKLLTTNNVQWVGSHLFSVTSSSLRVLSTPQDFPPVTSKVAFLVASHLCGEF